MVISYQGIGALGPVVASVILTFLLQSYLRVKAEGRRRDNELKSAIALMESYSAAFSAFLESDAPKLMKRTLIKFSELIEDREQLLAVIEVLTDEARLKEFTDAVSKAGNYSLAEMKDKLPEITRLYEGAIMSGLVASFMRWPDIAERFLKGPAGVTILPERRIDTILEAATSGIPGLLSSISAKARFA